jgi:hypothetical protein
MIPFAWAQEITPTEAAWSAVNADHPLGVDPRIEPMMLCGSVDRIRGVR